jgi:hypothetical protein
VLAHVAGALGGLPLPRWQFTWAVIASAVLAFFLVGSAWRRPRLADLAEGVALPTRGLRVLAVLARIVGLALFGLVLSAALFGSEFSAANPAPIGVFITFWVGLLLLSGLVGDLWRVLSPFGTLALVGAWVRSRLRGEPLSADDPPGGSHWPAAAGLAAFCWLELAYHSPSSPRVLGLCVLAYTVAVLVGAAVRGRGWLHEGEAFAVLFGLLGAMAPLGWDGSRLRLRWPLAGLGRVQARAGTVPLLLVALGATVFDGVLRTRFWFDLLVERLGWGYTAVNTLGLAWTIGVVALAYLVATRLAARPAGADPDEAALAFAPVLLPLVLAYAAAHYVAALLLDGQGFWYLVSDPYQRGWDLFGTAGGTVDFNLVSTTTIAWIQGAALAAGHAAAVVVAHDVALTQYRGRAALAAQYALLGLVIASAVASVALLVGA